MSSLAFIPLVCLNFDPSCRSSGHKKIKYFSIYVYLLPFRLLANSFPVFQVHVLFGCGQLGNLLIQYLPFQQDLEPYQPIFL